MLFKILSDYSVTNWHETNLYDEKEKVYTIYIIGIDMIRIKNLSTREFEKRIQVENVICFCAGQGLLDICERYPILVSRIIFVVDNFKHGQKIEIQNQNIPIVSMDEVKGLKKNTMLLISSIQYAQQIVKQLDMIKL